MPRCLLCGESLANHQSICPICREPQTDEAPALAESDGQPQPDVDRFSEEIRSEPLLPIARFSNAAEAGYFAHELTQGIGIAATVTMDESFDALSGYWSTRFVLAVPQTQAETATDHLRELIAESEPEDLPFETDFTEEESFYAAEDGPFDQRERSPGATPDEESRVNWVPIVLTLAAGSVVFWGVRTMNARPGPQAAAAGRDEQNELWDRLATPTGQWVQQLEQGPGRRELRFDARRREGVLREDVDGDGQFETEIPIRLLVP